MILQALTELYDDLCRTGKLSPPGWSSQKISYALVIDDDGVLSDIVSLKESDEKKEALPREVSNLPSAVKRSSGIKPNFLWDNATYLLGVGTAERDKHCFEACARHHVELLDGVEGSHGMALCRFFKSWDPDGTANHPVLKAYMDNLMKGENLIFRHNGEFIHEDAEVRECWQRAWGRTEDSEKRICLITGKADVIARTHPNIKGVKGAQSSGASLVSFNTASACSYNREQSYNAPVGVDAAFKYTEALNFLLSDFEKVLRVGVDSVVSWAVGGSPSYPDFFNALLGGGTTKYSEQDLKEMLEKLVAGNAVDFNNEKMDPDRMFYILCLSPNAARVSVRFFCVNRFGELMKNVHAHQERLRMVDYNRAVEKSIPLWLLLNETVREGSKDKSASNVLSGEVLRSIIQDLPYPTSLLNAVHLRIRAEHDVSHRKAAIIKAFYLKNRNKDVPEEVLQVALNPNSTNVPYILGRTFALLEAIQERANPGINTTIRDRYFNSASATPATVFPQLINLAQSHLRKIDGGLKWYFEGQLGELCSLLGETFPLRLNLAQQGAFQLGYYQQRQDRYRKSDKEEEVENE